MWVKLDEKTIELNDKEVAPKNRKNAFIFSCVILVLLTATTIFKYRTGLTSELSARPYSWEEIFEFLPPWIGFFIIVFFISWIVMTRVLDNEYKKDFICIKCEKLYKEKVQTCNCGGEVFSLNEVEWIE